MKGIRAGVFGVLVVCSASSLWGQEIQWRSASKRSTETPPSSAWTTSHPPASLGLPVAAKSASAAQQSSRAIVDPHVRPAAFLASGQPSSLRVLRFQGEEEQPTLPDPQLPALPDSPPPLLQDPPLPEETEKPEDLPRKEAVAPLPDTSAVPVPAPGFAESTAAGPAPVPCTPHCCSVGTYVCPPGCRLYGSAEYLLWWIKDASIPALVTTSPVASQGIIGQPGTVVLFGGNSIDMDERMGARFSLGYWLDPCHTWAVEGGFFFLGERAARFGATSNQFPLLARPFFNVNSGTEFSQIVTDPTRSVGGIGVLMPSQLWGAEANLRRNVCRSCSGRLDLIGGFRYLDLHEGVNILEMGTLLPGPQPFAGSMFQVFDNFDTRNQFYGGQLGAETELRRGRWFVNLRGKVALGVNHQTVNIVGGQVLTAPDGTESRFRGGLLALPSNMGSFTRNRFAVVPETGINLGYHITDGLRAYVGYTFLYWSDVLRPGDQIDRVLDVNQIPNFIPGPPTNRVRPIVPFRQSDFWAQGFNVGMEWRY